jgi:hypothetical protein
MVMGCAAPGALLMMVYALLIVMSTLRPYILTSHGFDRFFSPSINEVIQCQYGLPVHHPRTRIAHHHSDLFSRHGFVAVGWTHSARRFTFLVWTLRKSFPGVIQELITRWAEPIGSMMNRAAIHPDHCLNALFFSCYASVPLLYHEFLSQH